MSANKIEKAFLPVNKPFFKRDLRVGEDAIVNAPIFEEHSLTLYAYVPLIDLCSYDESNKCWHSATERDDLRVDYLICRGTDVIMAIDVTDSEQAPYSKMRVPYLFHAETTVLEMEQGQADSIVEALEDLLNGEFRPHWCCSMVEFSDELWDNLIDARLMEAHDLELWPTEYGNSEGLVTIIFKQGSMKEVGRSTQYSDRVWRKLREMFCDRDDYRGVRFLKKLGDMPLEEYMKEYPQLLERLKILLPESCRTYAQAAEAAHCLLQNPRGDNAENGSLLMHALALPLVSQARARTEACDALLEDGMDEFVRQLTEPDEQKRREILWAERQRRYAELRKEMDALKKEDIFLWRFLTLRLDDFFKGVGICTHLNYPDWLARAVCEYHCNNLDRDSNYTEALCLAYEKATSATFDQDDGTRLLYQLTIEPFHLIYQKAREVERLCGD